MQGNLEISGGGTGTGTIDVTANDSSTDNAIVRWDGATASLIQDSVVTISDTGEFTLPGTSTPATPAAGYLKFYAQTSQGHTTIWHLDQDGTEFQVLRDQVLLVRNTSGGSLAKGDAVDIYESTGTVAEVRKATATSTTTHAEGIMAETVANNGYGLMYTMGVLTGIDTSTPGWSEGNQLYLSDTSGTLSTTPGTYKQGLAIVLRVHLTLGSIVIYPDTMEEPHGTSHQSGGADAIKLDDLSAPDDNTDLNASTSAHGLMQKYPNTSTLLAGTGSFITASAAADYIGTTRGSVLYRGAAGWAILVPSTAGYVLTDGGVGADPSWAAASGGMSHPQVLARVSMRA